MKFTGPKVKLSRKLGVAVTPKAGKYMERRPYGPGEHGQKRRRKMSNYGEQLLEKQRLRFQYNVSEKQLRNYYKRANQLRGVTGDNLLKLLESRLDALVLRAGFARSIFAARQFVGHGHIKVNGRKVDIPSYRVMPGDVIEVKDKSRKLPCFNEYRMSVVVPDYLKIDSSGFGATYDFVPERSAIPVVCEIQKVVEFYSR